MPSVFRIARLPAVPRWNANDIIAAMAAEVNPRPKNYWLDSATEDLTLARDLFDLKRFSYCLFFCQLALEKMLKGIFAKRKESAAPPIHNLVRLADESGIKVTKAQKEALSEITTFNIEARYDIYKDKLYKKATQEFTEKYLDITTKLFNNLRRRYA